MMASTTETTIETLLNESIPEGNGTFSIPVRPDTDPIQHILFLVFGALGVVGNGYVLIVFLSSEHLRSQQINIFLINQSVADFLACVVLIITYKDTVS